MAELRASPTCDKCHGEGWIYGVRTLGETEYETADLCDCVREQMAKARFTGLSEAEMTFANFEEFDSWQKNIKEKAVKYANSPEGWFAVLGQSGAGKTHICTAICNRLRQKHQVLYIKNDVLRKLKFDTDEAELERYESAEYLYIDDLFKGTPSASEFKIAYELINERYFRGLDTIISSERTMEDLLRLDEAIAGRIREKSGENLLDLGKDKHKNYRFRGGKKK